MKKIILSLSLSLFFLHIQAQEAEQRLTPHEAGFNITAFVDNFLAIGNEINSIGNYLLTYKYFKNQRGRRVGMGGRIYKNRMFSDEEDIARSGSNINLRVGMEWRKKLHKRWDYYIGGDLVGGYSFNENKKFLEPMIEGMLTSWNIGAGPVAGIIFNLNERMSFSTEATLYAIYSVNENRGSYFDGTDLAEYSQTNKGYFAATALPSFIFFNVSF